MEKDYCTCYKSKGGSEPKVCTCINPQKNEDIKNKLLKEKDFDKLEELFKVYADSTRLKIINCLSMSGLCVCDIANIIGSSHSLASHQLKRLKKINVVESKRVGKRLIYSLKDEHISKVFKMGVEHIHEEI